MACFLVPAAEAIVTTVAAKALKKAENSSTEIRHTTNFSNKLGWLNKLLWGGSALLGFEHLWHGEVVPFFPFLTAVNDPASKAEMLGEMATTGVSMALLVTAVWVVMVAVSSAIEKRTEKGAEDV